MEIQGTFFEMRYFKENFTLVKLADNWVSSKWLPILEKNSNYEAWKKDIQMWCCLTELPVTKHAMVIHLSLSGRARDASSELEVSELEKKWCRHIIIETG